MNDGIDKRLVEKISDEMAEQIDSDIAKMVYEHVKLYFVTVRTYNEGGYCVAGDETVFVTPDHNAAIEYKEGLLSGKYDWPYSESDARDKDDVSIFSAEYKKDLKGFQL